MPPAADLDALALAPPGDPRADELRAAPRRVRWWYALKPASWPKLLVPAALGQGAGVLHAGRVDVVGALLGAAFSMALLVFIVLLNDWSDADVDRVKRSLYPTQCSPKTIPDQLLDAGALFRVGLLALGVGLVAAFAAQLLVPRPSAGWAAVGCAAIFVAYSLPPLRLNYRGGGELLEALGVGVALPAWNAYVQCGVLGPRELLDLLPAFALLSLASALASGLSDEVSDRRGGKRTFTTMLGNRRVRVGVLASTSLAGVLFVALPLCTSLVSPSVHAGGRGAPALAGAAAEGAVSVAARSPTAGVLAGWLGAAFCLVAVLRMRAVSPPPCTDAFASQALFKQRLHGAIWYGTLAVLITRTLLTGRG